MSFDLSLIGGDIIVDASGDLKKVTDTPKLRQDILKIVMTPRGALKNHEWYGCSIANDIIGSGYAEGILVAEIEQEIRTALEQLMALQRSQAVYQDVSLAEIIQALGEVYVERDNADPRVINMVITVLAKNLTKIEELFQILS